jgi:hypothetical protein
MNKKYKHLNGICVNGGVKPKDIKIKSIFL